VLKYGSIKQVYSKELSFLIKKKIKSHQYNFIILDHLRTFSLIKDLLPFIKERKIGIAYIAHNIEVDNLHEGLHYEKNIFKKIIYFISNFNLGRIEKHVLSISDVIFTLTEHDRVKLKKIMPDRKYKVLTPYFPWKRIKDNNSLGKPTKTLLILGSMNWYPNIEGTVHFIEKVFNKLINIDPEYKLFIVGNKPDTRILKKQNDNIIVTGRVSSVDPYIIQSDLLMIPNKTGSGIKIKFLEAVTKGLPVITYKENTVGYSSKFLKFPFVVSTSNEYILAIQQLINDYDLKRKFIESFEGQEPVSNIELFI